MCSILKSTLCLLAASLLLLICSPLYLYRALHSCLFKTLGALSAIWVSPDGSLQWYYNVVLTLTISGELSKEVFAKIIEEKFVFATSSEQQQQQLQQNDRCRRRLLYPEFRQYIKRKFGYPIWVDEPSFSVRNHIRLDETHVDEGKWADALKEYLEIPFSEERSPWEFRLWSLHEGGGGDGETRMKITFKFHHSLGDGYSMFEALTNCCDNSNELVKGSHKYGASGGGRTTMSSGCKLGRLEKLRSHLSRVNEASGSLFTSRPTTHQKVINCNKTPISFEDTVKAGARREGVSCTAIILATIANSIRRVLSPGDEAHVVPHLPFIYSVPVIARLSQGGGGGGLHNVININSTRFPLLPSIHSLLPVISSEMELADSFAPTHFTMLKLIAALPSWILEPIVGKVGSPLGVVLSSYPGPSTKLYIAGCQITDMDFIMLGDPSNVCLVFILTYANQIRIWVSIGDSKLGEKTSQLMETIEEELLKFGQSHNKGLKGCSSTSSSASTTSPHVRDGNVEVLLMEDFDVEKMSKSNVS